MVYSLGQIDWCDVPLVRPMPDPTWEKESATGTATAVAPYLTPVRWLLRAEELIQVRVTPNVPVDLGDLIVGRRELGEIRGHAAHSRIAGSEAKSRIEHAGVGVLHQGEVLRSTAQLQPCVASGNN